MKKHTVTSVYDEAYMERSDFALVPVREGQEWYSADDVRALAHRLRELAKQLSSSGTYKTREQVSAELATIAEELE